MLNCRKSLQQSKRCSDSVKQYTQLYKSIWPRVVSCSCRRTQIGFNLVECEKVKHPKRRSIHILLFGWSTFWLSFPPNDGHSQEAIDFWTSLLMHFSFLVCLLVVFSFFIQRVLSGELVLQNIVSNSMAYFWNGADSTLQTSNQMILYIYVTIED